MDKHIVLISGSGSENSHTLSLIKYIAEVLDKNGVKTSIWDLQKNSLPFLRAELHEDPHHPNKKVLEFNDLIRNSDGVILGTPIYHGSYSGILKNALDNLEGDILRQKPVGLISNGGGSGNIIALEHLRSVVRCLYGYSLQTQITTGEDDYIEEDKQFKIKQNIKKRAERLVEEIIYFMNLK